MIITIDDLTPEERARYDRGEAIWRNDPPDPRYPNGVSGSWIQKLDFGMSYEEWKKVNEVGYGMKRR
jgi:hypothetical protein